MAVNKTKQIKDPQKGHGLATTFNVLPGDVLIQITSPYLLVVEKESLSKVCSYCLLEAKAKTVSLQRCSKCRVPRYCSSKCQTRHWKSIHKQECPLLQELPNIPPTAVRGVIQLLLRHRYGTSLDPKWAGLESHVDELKSSGERWNDSLMQANAAVHFAKQSPELSGVAIHMLSRMSCNAFRATLPNQTPVGLCFEPAMAIANHSCDPNACVNFDGRTISLVALSPIEENEQIYISYIDPDDDRDSRRTLLKSQYFFDCDCPRCGDTGDPS